MYVQTSTKSKDIKFTIDDSWLKQHKAMSLKEI